MGSINSEEIISILKTEIENYDTVCKDQEVGTVIWVGDGIATVYGIEHAMYGEIVIFENGVKGMVQDIKRDQVGCIIFGKDTEIKEGTKIIGSFAFRAPNAKEIVLPDSVETIQMYAFGNCENLQKVVFGKGVKCIFPDIFRI